MDQPPSLPSDALIVGAVNMRIPGISKQSARFENPDADSANFENPDAGEGAPNPTISQVRKTRLSRRELGQPMAAKLVQFPGRPEGMIRRLSWCC